MDALDAKRVAQDFQASGRFTLTPEEAKKADKRSEEADRLVKNSKERLTDLAKSMLSEIKQIRSSKSSGIIRSIKRFVELQADIATKQRVAWENALSHLKDMSVDDDDTSTSKKSSGDDEASNATSSNNNNEVSV